MVEGFEDVWRVPVTRRRTPEAVLSPQGDRQAAVRARLTRLVRRAPEVMVKVSGRTRDPGHLQAHLDYISRNGALELEGRDGEVIAGRAEVRDLADAWSAMALLDSRHRANSPFSVSIVLSMPAGVDALEVRDAARAFAREAFANRFDYVFTLHTDAAHPHVHLSVRALGDQGERLNPKKADLAAWREQFAQALRDRGVEAEATPRRARGVSRKPERSSLAHLRRRFEAGQGAPSRAMVGALGEAARAAAGTVGAAKPWDVSLARRHDRTRLLYLQQAALLLASPDAQDRRLGREVARFVSQMPGPDTQRLALARELRRANQTLGLDRPPSTRDRAR